MATSRWFCKPAEVALMLSRKIGPRRQIGYVPLRN